MFALYATERNWLALSRPHLPLTAPVVATVGWAAFEALVPAAECGLVAVPPDMPVVFVDRLIALRRAWPHLPLVFIAERALPPVVRHFGVVLRPPLDLRRLWPAIQVACIRALLREAADRCTRAAHQPALVRRVLGVALAANPPLRSLADLARASASSPRVVARAYAARASAPPPGVPLPQVLDWVLLLHAVVARAHAPCWETVARGLGVHRHTLTRIAQDLAGIPLRPLSIDAAPSLRGAFRAAVLDPLGAPAVAGTLHAP